MRFCFGVALNRKERKELLAYLKMRNVFRKISQRSPIIHGYCQYLFLCEISDPVDAFDIGKKYAGIKMNTWFDGVRTVEAVAKAIFPDSSDVTTDPGEDTPTLPPDTQPEF